MNLKSAVLIVVGFLCLGLGAVGVFIPVLPTTPFVILAAACFGGGSPKLYHWLSRTKLFGPFIINYETKAGVAKNVKIKAIVFLWVMMSISIFMVGRLGIRILLLFIGGAVTTHILLLKTKKGTE